MMEAASDILARARFAASGPLFPDFVSADNAGDITCPDQLMEILREHGGMEGFLGNEYLRLFRFEELAAVNESYEIGARLPGLTAFGSNGCGEAYGFAAGNMAIVRFPFIPLDPAYVEVVARGASEWINLLAGTGETPAINPALLGKEVTEKHPYCLGGSPTDETNKISIGQAAHAEMARFWNKTYAVIKAKSVQGSVS